MIKRGSPLLPLKVEGESNPIVRVANRLTSIAGLKPSLEYVCEEAAKYFHVPAACIALYDESRDRFEPAACSGLTAELFAETEPAFQTIRDYLIHHPGEVAVIPGVNAQAERNPTGTLRAVKISCVAGAGIFSQNRFLGCLVLFSSGKVRSLNSEELQLYKGLADLTALVVENDRRAKMTEYYADKLQWVYDASLALNQSLLHHVRLDHLLEIAASATRADRAHFYPVETGQEGAYFTYRSGLCSASQNFSKLNLENVEVGNAIGWVAENRVPLRLPDIAATPAGTKEDLSCRSALLVPVEHTGCLFGVLVVTNAHGDVFTLYDERMLLIFANYVAVAIQNESTQKDGRCDICPPSLFPVQNQSRYLMR